jgi:hypothetical protein
MGSGRGQRTLGFRSESNIDDIGKRFAGPGLPSARAVAHRLLARGVPKHGTPEAVAAGVEFVFAHMCTNLAEWVGPVG